MAVILIIRVGIALGIHGAIRGIGHTVHIGAEVGIIHGIGLIGEAVGIIRGIVHGIDHPI